MSRKYKIHFALRASADLKELVGYIRNELREPQTALKWYRKIKAEISMLDEMPTRIGLVQDDVLAEQGFRMLIVGNYLIFFIVSENPKQVNIARILHSRRDWIRMLKG